MNTVNNILKWSGMTAVILGAALTSFRIDPLNIFMLNAGAALYLIWAIRIKEWNLIIVNGVLLLIYVLGVFLTPLPLDEPLEGAVRADAYCRNMLPDPVDSCETTKDEVCIKLPVDKD